MKKILFLIHDLGQGGAEKVLVNLVNNMDYSRYDITVMTLFDYGENRQFLDSKVKYKTWCKKMFRGNSHIMKLLKPESLHKWIIKEHYDVEIAYLEGPCARIISGCSNPSIKLVSWIHIEQHTAKKAATSFRNIREARRCYGKFDKIICVSKTVQEYFKNSLQVKATYDVIYNTNESEKIIRLSKETISKKEFLLKEHEIRIIGMGKLLTSKGFDRILKITKQLVSENYVIHTYILGDGAEKKTLEKYISDNHLENYVTLLGYQLNPYKYIAKCHLFVCASYAEGFSTATTEALILGVPVCTVEVSGMREMLGENNEYGLIVPNNDEALYKGIKDMIDVPGKLEYYRQQAIIRGKTFKTKNTVNKVEKMLDSL